MTQAVANAELTDDERMQEDVWVLHEFDLFKDSGLTLQKKLLHRKFLVASTIDFTIIRNPRIREEAKSFYRYHLEHRVRSPMTLIGIHSYIVALLTFLDGLDVKKSLLEMPIDTLFEQFQSYHYAKLNHVTLSKQQALGGRQNPITYIEASDTVNAIKKLYHFLEEQRDAQTPEMEKDIWDVRRLPFPVELTASRKRTKLVFTAIQQPQMRTVIKQYIYERLKLRRLTSVMEDMKGLKMFTAYLADYRPEIQSFHELTRGIVLEYLSVLNQKPFAMTTKRSRKGALDTFFRICKLLEIGDLPDEQLIRPSDHYHKNKLIPRLIPTCALEALHAHLDELPRCIRVMTIVLENTGMRANEACQLRTDCLKQDSAGDYYLQYYQSKTSHVNRIPIVKKFASLLAEEIRYIKEQFPDSPYLITMDGIRALQQDSWAFHVNRLAYRHHITDEAGKLFRFQAHQFRHTVATRYAMEGMSPNMIRSMLGHQDMRSISSYIEIRDVLADQKLRAFLQQEDARFKELRQQKEQRAAAIPLAYGYCNHQDLCDTALACYACGMFWMDDVDRMTAERYLEAVDARIQGLHLEAGSRQMEIYQAIRQKIQEVIASSC